MGTVLDAFNSDNFSAVNLTAAIDKLPYAPMQIGAMNLFEEQGVTTTTVVVEERDGKLSILPTAVRGTMPTTGTSPDRHARSFQVPHIPHNDAVMAEEVQDVRAFGQDNALESVATVVNQKLEVMKQNHEVTWEWHRLGAIKGEILDSDGSTTIYNLFTEFGTTQQTTNFDFASGAQTMRDTILGVKRNIEAALGAATFTGVQVFCGTTFFDRLIQHADVKEAFDRWQNGQFLRDDPRFTGFEFPRGVFWHEYRGGVGGRDPFIAADKAHAFPIGVRGLFIRRNAPGTFIEAANTVGKSIYVKQERMKFDVGVELHTQSNPLFICTRPRCLQLLDDTTS